MKTTRAFFFFNDTATTEIYTLSLHDALPICRDSSEIHRADVGLEWAWRPPFWGFASPNLSRVPGLLAARKRRRDRKSTRLNSSHANISYAVFCLKKKTYSLSTPLSTAPHLDL